MKSHGKRWATEAELVADFTAWVNAHGGCHRGAREWTVYAETAGWDILLVRATDGFQIGIEAKLSLNVTVLAQVINRDTIYSTEGPDVHAVLVPEATTQNGLPCIAKRLNITVIEGDLMPRFGNEPRFTPPLPIDKTCWANDWVELCPDRRCALPDYVPDVTGGHPSPLQLTDWKIRAIKICILLEIRGSVKRSDFKALKIDHRRWVNSWLKTDGAGGWIPTPLLPDFRKQHPVNYEEIKGDLAKWLPKSETLL